MPLFVYVFFLLFTEAVIGQELEARTQENDTLYLNLEDCISLALENSTSVLKALNKVSQSHLDIVLGYQTIAPSISGSFGGSLSSGSSLSQMLPPSVPEPVFVKFGNDAQALNASLNASFTIFDGLSSYYQLRQTYLDKDISEVEAEVAKIDIAFEAIRLFLEIRLLTELKEITRGSLNSSLEKLKQIKQLVEAGEKEELDIYRQLTQIENDKLELVRTTNNLNQKQLTLLRQLRLNTLSHYAFKDVPLDTVLYADIFEDSEFLYNQMRLNRRELKISDYRLAKAKWYTKSIFSSYFPTVSFGLQLGTNSNFQTRALIGGEETTLQDQAGHLEQLGGQFSYSLSLTFSWNLSNIAFTPFNAMKAKLDFDNQVLENDALRREMETKLLEIKGNYAAAKQEMEASRKKLQASQEEYLMAENKYLASYLSFTDFNLAKINLTVAKRELTRSYYNFMLQKISIKYATGNLFF